MYLAGLRIPDEDVRELGRKMAVSGVCVGSAQKRAVPRMVSMPTVLGWRMRRTDNEPLPLTSA